MTDEQRMQAMLEKYGYVVMGDRQGGRKPGDVLRWAMRPDVSMVVVGESTPGEWKRQTLEVFGTWGPYEESVAQGCQVLKVVAE